MIRLTLALVAVLFLGMKMAERLPEPPKHADDVAPSQTASLGDIRIAAPDNAPPAPVRRRPNRVPVATAPSVPFSAPAVIGPDGKPVVVSVEPAAVPQTDSPAATPEAEAVPVVRYVAASRVNVRQGPSTGNPVVGSVAYADAVEIVSEPTNGWVEIRIEGDGVHGYMAARFLQETPPG